MESCRAFLTATATLLLTTTSGRVSASLGGRWTCAEVKPINVPVEQLLGEWFVHELAVGSRSSTEDSCFTFSVTDLHTTGPDTASFMLSLSQDHSATFKSLVRNRTFEFFTRFPGLWYTTDQKTAGAIVAKTDDNKFLSIAMCNKQEPEALETLLLGREDLLDPPTMEALRSRLRKAGVKTARPVIVRNRAKCRDKTL